MPPKKITDIPIRSVGQFVSNLEETASDAFRLFRGQNTDECLLPRVMRLAKENHISPSRIDNVEQKMLERFRKESVPMLAVTKQLAIWELMSIAQHNGMPTRLLDWTANPLAGLWFAVATDPPKMDSAILLARLERARVALGQASPLLDARALVED